VNLDSNQTVVSLTPNPKCTLWGYVDINAEKASIAYHATTMR
jgi:hypothetical protein